MHVPGSSLKLRWSVERCQRTPYPRWASSTKLEDAKKNESGGQRGRVRHVEVFSANTDQTKKRTAEIVQVPDDGIDRVVRHVRQNITAVAKVDNRPHTNQQPARASPKKVGEAD